MYNSKRKPNDDSGQGGGLPRILVPHAREDDVAALREIARAGGGKHYVKARTVTVAELRRLRIEGFVELLDDLKGEVTAKLTVRALQALAAAPGVVSR